VTRLKWKLDLVRLEILLILDAPECTVAQKLFWMHPIYLLGGVSYVESPFSLFGDSVSVGAT
jgi:hypothetical protein